MKNGITDLSRIRVHRYSTAQSGVYSGCIEPVDKSWTLYVRRDGTPELHLGETKLSGLIAPHDTESP